MPSHRRQAYPHGNGRNPFHLHVGLQGKSGPGSRQPFVWSSRA
jgi:hypothetical protein